MQIRETTVGVDVSQAVLDVWVDPNRECWHVSNDPSGADDLASMLCAPGQSLVVVEVTGGVEDRLVASLITRNSWGGVTNLSGCSISRTPLIR